MTNDQNAPDRIDDDLRADDVPGTSEGSPTAGVEISETDADEAVVPDDNAMEVDGPQAGHA